MRQAKRWGRLSRRLGSGFSVGALAGLSLCVPASAQATTASAHATTGTAQATTATAPATTANVTVASATDLPAIVQNSHVVARDNGQSTGYHGRSVWIFDDTELQDPSGFISNSGAVTDDLNASQGITLTSSNPFDPNSTGTPEQLIPETASEQAFTAANDPTSTGCTESASSNCGAVFGFWPGPVISDPARHRILVFYGKLCRGSAPGSTCASGFIGHSIGSGVVALNMRTDTVSRLEEHGMTPIDSVEGPDPTLMFNPDESFGSTADVVVGKFLYAYGACTSTDRCELGRVPLPDLTDMNQWRYYAGNDASGAPVWSTEQSDAIPMMDGGAAGSSVAWDPALHAYIDVFMAGITSVADYELAPTPWGPWSSPQAMFTGVPTNTLWDYACFAHPELQQDGGLIQYVSYYDPQTGQQDLVKVTFSGTSGYKHVYR